MRQIKTLVLLISLVPTTAFADEIVLIAKNEMSQAERLSAEAAALDAQTASLAASMLNRGTASGTKRGPASVEMHVTLIKKAK